MCVNVMVVVVSPTITVKTASLIPHLIIGHAERGEGSGYVRLVEVREHKQSGQL